jgi:hypothetical protein
MTFTEDGDNGFTVLSSEAPLELAAELLVNAVFNRSSNQRLRLRKVKFGYLHGDSVSTSLQFNVYLSNAMLVGFS